jgi:hypothetical protein
VGLVVIPGTHACRIMEVMSQAMEIPVYHPGAKRENLAAKRMTLFSSLSYRDSAG